MKQFDVICDTNEEGEVLPVGLKIGRDVLSIRGINDRWYDEKADYFKVAASDGRLYLLRQDMESKEWSLMHTWQLDA